MTDKLTCGGCGGSVTVEGGRVWPCVKCLAKAREERGTSKLTRAHIDAGEAIQRAVTLLEAGAVSRAIEVLKGIRKAGGG